MLSEGTRAPTFELPALVDGSYRQVALEEYVGDDVVILAFYPGDFNPACDETSCDLDELDLFTMQKDVTILGISPDSVYSHRAFAKKYDLKVPLLADTDHEVAEQYDVDFVDDLGQRLVERAVAVVDHDGVVQYAWSTTRPRQLPKVEEIKDAIAETGGDDTAFARYRVGHAHFIEGRRAFTAAMGEFGDYEWMMAQTDFQRARDEFEEAADHFDTAVRFVDDEALVPIYDDAMTKANALWQAADWLAKSASEYSSGNGAEGQELREDAEGPLDTVRGYLDPPDPDEWPPEMTDLERDESEVASDILPERDDGPEAALEVDIDAEVEQADSGARTANGDDEVEPDAVESDTSTADSGTAPDADEDETIDDAELEAIHAELEANNPESEPTGDELGDESTSIVEEPPGEPDEAASDDGPELEATRESRTEGHTQSTADEGGTDESEPADEEEPDDETTIALSDPTGSEEPDDS